MTELPPFLTELVDELAAAPDVVAVVLGGSRAQTVGIVNGVIPTSTSNAVRMFRTKK